MWEVMEVIPILTVLACLMISLVQFDSHEEKGSVLHYKATLVMIRLLLLH